MAKKDDRMLEQIVPEILAQLSCGIRPFSSTRYAVGTQAFSDLESGLFKRIQRIIRPSVNFLFLEYLNETDTLDLYLADQETGEIDEQRRAFGIRISENHCAYLQQRLPSLVKLLKDNAEQYNEVIRELLARLDQAYEDITETLFGGRKFMCLRGVNADSGDVHNHGRSTMVLSTDAGKLVYKPHDVGIDQFCFRLFASFFSDVMRAPAVCAYDGYGFTEYVENRPAETESDARAYMHNLGGFCAVVQMMGSSDLHHNNVLCDGTYPVIIDYEVIATPGRNFKVNSLAWDLDHSLLYSSLLSQRRGEIDLSILFGTDEESRSAPVIDGRRRCVMDYPDAFFEGFRKIYLRCMERREELRTFMNGLKGISIRHLYRSTGTYASLLDKILEPGWIEDKGLKEELDKMLSLALKRSGSDADHDVTEAERESLLRGDIPYLYMKADECDLYAEGRVVYPDFFPGSCLDHILSRLDCLSEADMRFETELLKKAMTRVIRRAAKGMEVPEDDGEERTLTKEELLHQAEDIFRQIAGDVLETPSGHLTWFGPNYYLETGMELLDTGLFNGVSGLAVFFAAMHAASKDETIRKQCEDLIDRITDRLETHVDSLCGAEVLYPNLEDVSISRGLAGKLLACRIIARYMNSSRHRMLAERIASLLPKADIRFSNADYYNGLSGLLKVLCFYDDLYALPGMSSYAMRLAEHIMKQAEIEQEGAKLWRTLSQPWAISGAGHGQSGIASALLLAARRFGRADFREAAEAGMSFEKRIYSPTMHAWPDLRRGRKTDSHMCGYCSGAPGIGINALNTRYACSDQVVKQALASVRQEELLEKDILCCGNCSIIEFLLQAGYADEANHRMERVIRRAGKNGGFRYYSASLTQVFSPNLLFGAAGIGYELLRLFDPEGIEPVLI